MGIKAKWTTTCDGCGKVRKLELELSEANADGTLSREDGMWTSDDSMWGPGVPDYWVQVPYDKKTKKEYLLFHDRDCYKGWLLKQGRTREVKRLEKAVSIA